MSEFAGMGPDAPIVRNAAGGGQSAMPYRFDLVDGPAFAAMAAVLKEGADKYGADNWRLIPVEDHLNHLIGHAYAYLSGDRSDEHLAHIMCRAMFAKATDEPDVPPTEPAAPEGFHFDERYIKQIENHYKRVPPLCGHLSCNEGEVCRFGSLPEDRHQTM